MFFVDCASAGATANAADAASNVRLVIFTKFFPPVLLPRFLLLFADL
jgi:hypothetical protein